jgi:hypothetical protein
MSCVKKYYAENGQESVLFNQLVEEFGEWRAEEIYLKLNKGDFQELFQKEVESTVDLTPDSPLSKKLETISNRTPFLREIESIGNMNQYAKYLSSLIGNSDIRDVVWSEPSDRTRKPNSLKTEMELSSSKNLIGGISYFVYAPTIPNNLRDAQPHLLFASNPYITKTYLEDQANWDINNRYHFVNNLAESDYGYIYREDGNGGVASIALINPDLATSFRLGSPEDVAMFKEWVRTNPLEGPTYKSKTQKFDFKGSVYDSNGEPRIDIVTNPSMLNRIMNIRLQKLTSAEIANNLINSSVDKISEAKDDGYSVLGKTLSRVSTILDRNEFAPYRGTSSGEQFELKGTRYHNILQDIVNGKPQSEIKKQYGLQESEIGFVNQMTSFINGLKSQGGTLIAELKIASMNADSGNGVAGTIDLVHILPSGRAVVYDLKTVHSKTWDPSLGDYYKAKRYTYQTMFYSTMLEKGDTELSRVAVPVEAIYVIPVEITYGATTDEVLAVSMRPAENIKTEPKWKDGKKSFYDKFRKKVDDLFYGTKKSKKTKTDFDKRNVTSFLNSVFQVQDWNVSSNLDQRAINLVERQGLKAKSFRTNDGVSHQWESEDKQKRIEQAKKVLAGVDGKHNSLVTEDLKSFFERYTENRHEDVKSYSYDLNSKSEVIKARTQRVVKILNSAQAEDIEFIPGYDDVVLIKRADGTYDIMTMTDIPLDREIPIKFNATLSKFRGQYRTLFGNYLTPLQANKMRANVLKNQYGDFQKLRLGLIGLELIKENPDIRINRVIVDYINGTNQTFSQPSNMKDIAGQIKIMHSIPEIKNAEPSVIKELLDDEKVYNETAFGDDPIVELYDYLVNQWDTTHKSVVSLKDQIEKYQKDQTLADELANQILESEKGIINLIRNKYPNVTDKELMDRVSADETFTAMARAYISLKGYGMHPEADVSNEFMGFLTNWIRSPQMTGRKMLDKFYEVFRYHLNEIKKKIDSFLQEKDPYIQALIEEDSVVFRGVNFREKNVLGLDALTGMTRRVFEPLIQTQVNANGDMYKVPLLIEEGSSDFAKLSKAQQNFIKYFNDTVQKYYPGWKRGQIPMLEISSDSLLYESKKKLTKGDFRKAAEDFKKSISTFWEMASEKGNFRSEAEMTKRMSDAAYDSFKGQIVSGGEGEFSTQTLKNFGLNNDMSLFDPSLANSFETDLEKVLTLFSSSYIRKAEMDKALPKYRLFRSLFKWTEIAYGAPDTYSGSVTQQETIKQMDDFVADMAFNIRQGEDKIASKWVNLGIRLASISFVGLNWKVFVGNTVQMSMSNLTDAFLNTVTNDPRFPGMKEFGQAITILSQASTNEALSRKIHYLRRMYLPEDTGVLTGIKGQKAARGLINEQTAYMIDRSMELGFKEHMLVAQMLKDGTWDAHDISVSTEKDGFRRWRITYDPKKDARFKGQDGQALYEAIKASMVEKGEITQDEEIPSAYDWKLRERLKAYISRAIGTFDRDLSSQWARYSLMHAMSQFRNWFRDKFWRITITEYDAEIMGQYKKSKDGKYYWASEPMKGMLKTLADAVTMPKEFISMARKGELTLEDKKNLWYAGTSLITLSTLAILSAALLADDDEEEFAVLKVAVQSAQDELLSTFTIYPFLNISVSPLVFASYYQRLFSTTMKALAYGSNADFKQMSNTFVDVVPVINQLPDDYIKFEED